MYNYIKSELYNFFCAKKISWIFLLLLSAFIGISSCFFTFPIIAPISSAPNSIIVLNSLNNLFPIPLIIAVNYFCSAYKNGLFKNNISYGLKRRNIYVGKFIIGLLLLTLFWLCALATFTSTIIFKFGFSSMQTPEFISNLKVIKIVYYVIY